MDDEEKRLHILDELRDLAHALIQPRKHIEPVLDDNGYGRKRLARAYTTHQPSLLDQLQEVAHEGLRVGARSPGSVDKPASRPPGNFEAMAALATIGQAAKAWADSLTGKDYRYPYAAIWGLVEVAPATDDNDLRALLGEMRYWHGMATLITGWREPPYVPPVRCPQCQVFGSLRVDVEEKSGYCTTRTTGPAGLACGLVYRPGTAEPLFVLIREALKERKAA